MRIEEKLAELCGIDEDADGVRLERADLQSNPVDKDDMTYTKISENEVVVSYVAYDPDRPKEGYWDNDDGAGTFEEFRSEAERDIYVESVRKQGKLALVVNKYDHSGLHFSVRGTVTYGHMGMDTKPSGVMVPCPDVQEKYQFAMREAGNAPDPASRAAAEKAALDEAIRDSNVVLDNYSKFCNGEIYEVIQETWKVSPDGRMEMTDIEENGGLIGYEYALDRMKEEIPTVEDDSPQP